MAAEDNLSLTLFRGVMTNKVKQPLGIHWSSVKGVVGKDRKSGGEGASMFASPSSGEKHSIITAKVNPHDVVQGKSLEDSDFFERYSIGGGGHPEYEEPIYPESRVKVTKVTRIRNVAGERKARDINYNPPREMEV